MDIIESGSDLAMGADAIWNLLKETINVSVTLPLVAAAPSSNGCKCGQAEGNGTSQYAQLTTLTIGDPVPAFELPDLAGERRTLATFRGRPFGYLARLGRP
jgi:hypothetical protein